MLHPSVELLATLLQPPSKPAGSPADWGQVATRWGVTFPGDHRDFLAVYGAGTIDDYLVVATVLDPASDLKECAVSELTSVARSLQQEDGEWPYLVRPDEGGLICWGMTVDAAVLYWDTADPDQWPVVVRNREGDFARFDFGMAEFVVRMLGPSGERPLGSPRLFGAPNSRFLNEGDEKRIKGSGGDPWGYLEELFEWQPRGESQTPTADDAVPVGRARTTNGPAARSH
ncbi:hypothetical protein [Kitasatospora sp. P5_F3]